MPLPNPNIFRYDGPFDHYVMRPMGVMRCPPAPPAPPARPQVDVDDYLHLHEPSFDRYITWQKDSIAVSEATIVAARRARDAAEFKQWAAIGILVPATGMLATTYAMMFTFPFIVPGAILFAVTSVGIALLVGFEERARSEYNEAHSEWQRASWVLESQQTGLTQAEKTFARLQAQFAPQLGEPGAQVPQPAARPPTPQRRGRRAAPRMPERTPLRQPSPARAASAAGSQTTSGASDVPRPEQASYWSAFVPSADAFGWRHYEGSSSSSSGASTPTSPTSPTSSPSSARASTVSLAPVATTGQAQPVLVAADSSGASAAQTPVVAPSVVEGWEQD